MKTVKRLGFEFKYTDMPKLTRSMIISMKDLKLDELIVIFPGKETFPLANQISAFGLENYLQK